MPLFPTTPIDGQIVYVNGTNYFWSGSRQTWKRVLANALSASTSVTSGGGSGSGSGFTANAFTTIFTADGNTTAFNFTGNITDQDQLVVHVDGIYQVPGVNFTANTDWIIFSPAPIANTEIVVQNAVTATDTSNTAQVTVSTGAPANPVDGDLWLDSDNGKLAVYLSGGWIEVSSGTVTQISGGGGSGIPTDGTIDADPSGTTVNSTAVALDSWAAATYRTAKYIISVNGTSNYQATEALVIHDGVDSYLTTYGIIYTGANVLMSFSSNIVSGNVVLWGTGVTSGNLVKLQRTLVRI
jgi:hypothetical protein